MVTTNGKPIDILTRVSSKGDRDADAGFGSPETQIKVSRGYLTARDLPIGIELIQDIDKSGTTMDRPGLQEGLQRIRNGQSGGICFAYQSRFARNVKGALDTLDEIVKAGGAIYAPGLPDYTEPEGRQNFIIQAAIDEAYANRAAKNAHEARQRSIDKGRHFGKFVPVGYAKKNGKLELTSKSKHVSKAFEMRANNVGPTLIANYLNKHGLKTSRGNKITRAVVHDIIQNRVYLGELHYRYYDQDFVKQNTHPAITDETTWLMAQPNGKRPRPVTTEIRALLKGVLTCSSCGMTLKATNNGAGVHLYRCSGQSSNGECERRVYVRADVIENAVEELFWSVTEDIHALGIKVGPDISQMQATYAKAKARFEYLQTDDAIDAYGATHAMKLKESRLKVDSLATELATAQAASQASVEIDISLKDDWQSMSISDKNLLMKARFQTLLVERTSNREITLTATVYDLEDQVWTAVFKTR